MTATFPASRINILNFSENLLTYENAVPIIYLTGKPEGKCSLPAPAKFNSLKNGRQLSQG